MPLKKVFEEGWSYLKDLLTQKPDSTSIIGPFKASIHLAGDTQRGVLIPKEYHEERWFKDLLNRKKHKITLIIEELDSE